MLKSETFGLLVNFLKTLTVRFFFHVKAAFAKLQQIIDRPTDALSDVNREEWTVIYQLLQFIPLAQRSVHATHTTKTTRLNHVLIKTAVRVGTHKLSDQWFRQTELLTEGKTIVGGVQETGAALQDTLRDGGAA